MNASASGLRQVLRDCLDLFELQAQLVSVDSQVAKAKLQRAVLCTLIGLGIGGSTLTVMMITAGLLISELAALSPGVAMLIVSGVGFGIVLAMLGIAVMSLKAAAAAMQQTQSELAENYRWLKATLVRPNYSARHQLRRESYPVAGNHGAPTWVNDPAYQATSESETISQ